MGALETRAAGDPRRSRRERPDEAARALPERRPPAAGRVWTSPVGRYHPPVRALWLFASTLGVLSLSGARTLAAFVPAYLATWATFEVAARVQRRRARSAAPEQGPSTPDAAAGRGYPPAGGRPSAWAPAILAAVALVFLPWAELAELDQLDGLAGVLRDRARLSGGPVIAPPLVSAAEPQVFHVYAEGASTVTVRFGPSAAPLSTTPVGHGLFRLRYDPRADGPPRPADGPIEAELTTDRERSRRVMEAVSPLAHPRAVCASAAAGVAATPSEETDTLFIITGTREAGVRIRGAAVEDGPTACGVLAATGEIAVVHRSTPALLLVDWTTGQVTRRLPFPEQAVDVAISPDGSLLAAAISEPPALALWSPPAVAAELVPLSYTPGHLSFGSSTGSLIVAGAATGSLHFHGRELGWRERRLPLLLGRPASTLARSPSGHELIAVVSDYLPGGGAGSNHHLEDQLLVVDPEVMFVRSRHPTARRVGDEVVGGAGPGQVLLAGDGAILFTATGHSELVRLDRRAGTSDRIPWPDEQVDLRGVQGLAELADGLLVLTAPAVGTIAVLDLEARRFALVHQAAPADAALDPALLERRLGELAFVEATRSGGACVSCHTDHDTDRSLHDIGQLTPRPTLSVRGVTRTAPYLRGASYSELAGLEHFASTVLGGYRSDGDGEGPEHALRREARRRRLERYVSALPRRPRPRAGGSVDELRLGVEALVKARCVDCHAFPAFTNLAQLPSQLLFPGGSAELEVFDVPSLAGASIRAPLLMHDGRARTLEEVLDDPTAEGRHGVASALLPAERAALLAFLEGL